VTSLRGVVHATATLPHWQVVCCSTNSNCSYSDSEVSHGTEASAATVTVNCLIASRKVFAGGLPGQVNARSSNDCSS